jgi:uncharacterized protein (DUF58 family)
MIVLSAFLGLFAALVPLFPILAIPAQALLLSAVLWTAVDWLTRPRPGAIRILRRIEPLYQVGREGKYQLFLRNETDRPLMLDLREALPPTLEAEEIRERWLLKPREEVVREVSFVGLERGEHQIPPPGARVRHLLSWLEHQERIPLADRILVSPGRPAAETDWILNRVAFLEEAGEKKTRRKGTDREFESLREYVPGDEIRRIDWKATARRHRPQVRQYQSERNAEVILALDCGRLMGSLIGGVTKLDLAMTPLLDLAAVALRRGERVGFFAFDSQLRAFLPPRTGLGHLNAMMSRLATLPAGNEPTSFLRAVRYLETRHRKRSLILVFTDFTDEISAQEMYASLAALTRRHVLIFVGVADPHLEEIFQYNGGDSRALFEKAVAGQLLLERRRTVARIERLGIFTVDAEPRRLSGPLIRRYLQVRFKGAL